MKLILLLCCVLGAAVYGQQRMQVLMVDQHGEVNVPGVLATTAQMATNQASLAIAQATADAAKSAAQQGSNMVSEVVSRIMANELVVYRRGFVDSFEGAVLLTESDALVICRFLPNLEIDSQGRVRHQIHYACTVDVGAVQPVVSQRYSLVEGDFEALPASAVGTPQPLPGTYTDQAGNVFENVYSVDIWVPQAQRAFYVVYLDGGTPDGDGSVLDIVGGIQGGKSATVDWGGNRLTFRGGLLVGVEVLP